MHRFGLLLAGCGLWDGSDPSQAVGLQLAIEAAGDLALPLAPGITQHDAIDGLSGELLPVPRQLRPEAARLTRGVCRDTARTSADEVDAVVIPGGLGVIKSLCTVGVAGAVGVVEPSCARLLSALRSGGRPVATLDEGVALLAAAWKGQGLRLAAGADAALRTMLQALGHVAVDSAPGEIVEDKPSKVVSAVTQAGISSRDAVAPIEGLLQCLRGWLQTSA